MARQDKEGYISLPFEDQSMASEDKNELVCFPLYIQTMGE